MDKNQRFMQEGMACSRKTTTLAQEFICFLKQELAAVLARISNRGSQHISIKYSECLAEAGIEPSVDIKGNSYDNALTDTINGLHKIELIYHRALEKPVRPSS